MKRLPKEDRAGLYVTVIVHLVALIILLASQLERAVRSEESFILDFSKLEQIEKLQREIEFKEEISRRLEEMIAEGDPVRNVAVDRGALKDDRGTDAEQLYKDAERLQKELDNGFKEPSEDYAEVSELKKEKEDRKKEQQKYSGPSVLSYELEGRKASHLPIPAYRCLGAGEVKVLIAVDNSGTVIAAKIDESCSSPDGCLRAFAIRAARLSKFSASQSAPPKQAGNIVYKFIAQ